MSKKAILLGKGQYGQVKKYPNGFVIKNLFTEQDGLLAPLEIDILRRFRHPNLLYSDKVEVAFRRNENYVDIFLPEGYPIPRIKRKGYVLANVLWQLANGVAFLHQHDILHLDIDPSNVLSFDHNNYRLIDFSLSRKVDHLPGKEVLSLSPLTIHTSRPPELFVKCRDGYYHATFASDIWSLGLLFLRLALNQRYLYHEEKEKQQYLLFKDKIATHCWKKDIDVDEIDPELIDLITEMLDWSPQSRPAINAVLSHPYFKKYNWGDNVKIGGYVLPNPPPEVDLNEKFVLPIKTVIRTATPYSDLPINIILESIDLYHRFLTRCDVPMTINLDRLILACFILTLNLHQITHRENFDYCLYRSYEKMIIADLDGFLVASHQDEKGTIHDFLLTLPKDS